MRSTLRAAAYLWASPVSIAALPLAALGAATGGRLRVLGGVLEADGGALRPILAHAVPGFAIGAITLGHVVLGANAEELSASREHERVHVRQYERWGPLFPFVYFGASLLALACRRSPYAGNAFELQAARESGEGLPA
jgi:hypothetical protein